MTQIIANLSKISGDYAAVFCDLWGCLHNGVTAFPAAVAALQSYRATGGRVILLTNAPRPKADVMAQLVRMKVPADAWDEIVTSGQAAQYGMLAGMVGTRVHHIGAEKDMGFFRDFDADMPKTQIDLVPLDQAQGIICTGLVDDITQTPADYRATLLMAKTLGLPMLCANPDVTVHVGGQLQYCAGALAAEYQAMGGKALYFGKPHPPIYDLARQKLAAMGVDGAVLCIGDGINTDILGASGEALDSLYITSGIDHPRFGNDPATPDAMLLEAFLTDKQLSPTYSMGFLK
jgi:HAD superfamily hydrolase (TIGR01459 family)